MSTSPVSPGTQLASRFGLSDRVFAGRAARRLAETIEQALEVVEAAIAEELGAADPLVDAMSRYLYEAGGKRVVKAGVSFDPERRTIDEGWIVREG